MNRAADWLLVSITMTVIGIGLLVGCYWLFIDTAPPMTHTFVGTTNDHGKPTTTFIRGERMVIVRDSCVTDTGMVFYSRVFVEKQKKLVYFMPNGWVALRPGCRRSFNAVDIPTWMEPGEYSYVVNVDYQNNPLYMQTIALPVPEVTIK